MQRWKKRRRRPPRRKEITRRQANTYQTLELELGKLIGEMGEVNDGANGDDVKHRVGMGKQDERAINGNPDKSKPRTNPKTDRTDGRKR